MRVLLSCIGIQLNNSLNRLRGNICLGAWPSQTNWHIIWSIHHLFLKLGSQQPSGDWPGPCGKSWGLEMLTQRGSGGLWGAPLPEPFAQYGMRQNEMGKGRVQGARNPSIHTPPHPNLGQENRPWDLQARKGGPRITARLDLNAAPKEQRRLCVITSCFALAHPPRTASPGNPAGYGDMGGSAEDINRNSIVCPVSLHTWAGCLLNNFLAAAELKSWAGRWRGWLAFMSQECARLDSTADRCRTEACSPKRLA